MSTKMELQVGLLVAKVKHYLITMMGRTAKEATPSEFYRALSYALREEIMVNWAASKKTYEKQDVRTLYYLSMEYLPGRLLGNNLSNLHAQELVQRVVHEFNFSLPKLLEQEPDPGLGNGGLGRLASCFLDSLATLKYPAMGYGLRYHYGMFDQQIWAGVQVEQPNTWLLNENPWETRNDSCRRSVKFGGLIDAKMNDVNEEVFRLHDYEEVRTVAFDLPIVGYNNQANWFNTLTLRLWTTKESPRNFQLHRYNAGRLDQAAENIALTDVLYPNDEHEAGKRARIKQEFLLVSASIKDIIAHHLKRHNNFASFADKVRIQINDTHPALAVAELTRQLTHRHNLPWNKAWEITQSCISYTNHTVLEEALEKWSEPLLGTLLPRQLKVIQKINADFCAKVRQKYPGDEERVQRDSIIEGGQVRMAYLSIVGSHTVNGVAELHTNILKKTIFKDFYELTPEKFINVTNGVTQRRWLLHCNPQLAEWITTKIGSGWITDFNQIRQIENFATDPQAQEEFRKIKLQNKKNLIENYHELGVVRDMNGVEGCPIESIDPNSLFDVQIKRFHEYKRQLMNTLHIIMKYHDILDNPDGNWVKRTFIFSGKAAAGYKMAKTIIHLIHCIARKVNTHPIVSRFIKVIFIENYSVSVAEKIIPAADLSEQISTAGMEASGTGNMKLAINGALTIGTDDGANVEMRQEVQNQWWPFCFGASSDEIHKMQREKTYNSYDIYSRNPQIRRAVDALRDRTFTETTLEHDSISSLYYSLLEGGFGQNPDRYFVLYDLESYYNMQKQVDTLFQDKNKWTEYAIRNIAGMGKFTADNSIEKYAKKIWGLEPCPIDLAIHKQVREAFGDHNQYYNLALAIEEFTS
jgi:starch phosphorylase